MLGQWLQDRVERIPGARTPRSAMYCDWCHWNASEMRARWSEKSFYSALEERGLLQIKSGGIRYFENVRLKRGELDLG